MSEEMTREQAIGVIQKHRLHWERLLRDKICNKQEGEEAITAFAESIAALSAVPCDDAISRQAAIKEVYKMPSYAFASVDVLEILEQLPSVTPKQRTGHWIIISVDARGVLMKCDKCERLVCTESPGSYTYCPSCGAKMVESEDKE